VWTEDRAVSIVRIGFWNSVNILKDTTNGAKDTYDFFDLLPDYDILMP
jgi:hypothetical protein